MKRFLCFFTVFVLLLCALPLAVSAKELKTVTLNVYNWGQYIADGEDDLPDTNELFEEYFNENLAEEYGYKIEVNYSTYPSNEDMYNKIVSGSASFDVIVPSDYMIERMIAENLLVKLNICTRKRAIFRNIGTDNRFYTELQHFTDKVHCADSALLSPSTYRHNSIASINTHRNLRAEFFD